MTGLLAMAVMVSKCAPSLSTHAQCAAAAAAAAAAGGGLGLRKYNQNMYQDICTLPLSDISCHYVPSDEKCRL